jgi:hypothetical protein
MPAFSPSATDAPFSIGIVRPSCPSKLRIVGVPSAKGKSPFTIMNIQGHARAGVRSAELSARSRQEPIEKDSQILRDDANFVSFLGELARKLQRFLAEPDTS